ncbi:hypothetical protein [Lederbergia lenta]|uniref:hypothetical protein n=1 Tax=Lederbergia lenta TaxID=1467 RepID=UPI00203F5F75|nr:hypothetical protein [Lederbergia lenta]MCM3109915.1 hypothetical protein [Lederbergia lenta]
MGEFSVGQEVIMFVKGAGVTSKEQHIIEDIADGIISLDDSEKTFDLNGKCTKVDNFFGFSFWIE